MSALGRAVRSEWVRIGGARGPLLRASLPLGVLLPIVVSLVVGAVAESLSGGGGLLQTRAVSTTNSIYWVVYLGVAVHTVVAAYVGATAHRGSVGELTGHLLPRRAADLLGRWIVTGLVGAIGSFLAVVVLLVALPLAYPTIYGPVSIGSAEGLRFLWAVPAYCLAAAGIGIGVGALVRVPAAAVSVVALWSLFAESALIYVPHGGSLIRWMPFLNGVYGTGQEIALGPPWGVDGGLAYVLAVAVAAMTAGALASRVRPA